MRMRHPLTFVTQAISLLGSQIGAANFSWSGGALAKSGRIVAVPYNDPYVLEIGESVCTTTGKMYAVESGGDGLSIRVE